MSQLANIHQQVVPMRTAHALPLDNVTLCFPHCLFSKPSNIFLSAPQNSKVILRAERSSRNLNDSRLENLETVDPEDSYYFVCVLLQAQSGTNEAVKKQRAILATFIQLGPC